MSLFGSLSSGVSGLTAQSSAMGAISDNITNVSTIGYKNTQVDFKTLVTAQTSSTFYSAGGVQSTPRQDTGVQGLLQASTSQTDIALSGGGYFIVNESGVPTNSDQYLFTRAGSFFQDSDGYLRNTAGFYLQGWPTDPSGTVIPANDALTLPNQNIISTDFMETVNLNRVGGTATSTSEILIGANLPSNAVEGDTFKTDVQFFDSLGNPSTMSVNYTRTSRENEWDIDILPPQSTDVITLEDSSGNPYKSVGQVEFTALPAAGAVIVIDGITYRFDSTGAVADTATIKQVDVSASTTTATHVAALMAKIIASDSDYDSLNGRIAISAASTTTLVFEDDGTGAITIDPSGLLTSTGARASTQDSSFSVRQQDDAYTDERQLLFDTTPADGETIVINGITYTFQSAEAAADGDTIITTTNASSALAADITTMINDLEAAIEANDPDFAAGSDAIRTRLGGYTGTAANANVDILMLSTLSASYTIDVSGLSAASIPTEPDGTVFAAPAAITVDHKAAIVFDADGIPSDVIGSDGNALAFSVTSLEILGFANGAADMDGNAANSPQIAIDFGTAGKPNGFTQYGDTYTPGFINQNGSQFGTFAGVTIGTDGLVTALFDNGETRKVYKLPIATFVNVNQLGSKSGNVWNATEASGDPTLREADSGPSGQVIQGTLEASTVDIGTEFTKMIVVQRAFSAAAKIISTADEMLEELLRIKR